MPNKNYVKGRAKEYRIINYFRALDYLAFRSAGSHSPIDVIAINTDMREIRLIQAKPNSMSKKNKEKIKKENEKLNGIYSVIFEVL